MLVLLNARHHLPRQPLADGAFDPHPASESSIIWRPGFYVRMVCVFEWSRREGVIL